MAHEQSETIQNDLGKWVNVYGKNAKQAGEPLPLIYPFEKLEYETVDEAVSAAKQRSRQHSLDTQGPKGKF